MQVDVLIVGQGIAGSLLARELMQRGLAIRVVDNGNPLGATRVAAGLINPLTGKRIALSRNFGDYMPVALDTYAALEKQFGIRLWNPMDIIRVFRNASERDFWERRQPDPLYAPYVGPHVDTATMPGMLPGEHGAAIIKGGGWVDTTALTSAIRAELQGRHALCEEEFSHDDLKLTPDGATWQGFEADRVVFCEGWHIRNNPWFKHLPVRPDKGEILTLAMDTASLPEAILNRGHWLIPVNADTARAGASYSQRHTECVPEEKSRSDIEQSLQIMLDAPYNVVGQTPGIRPAIRDFRPTVGVHASHPQLAVFNALGSKGMLYAPGCAKALTAALLDDREIPEFIRAGRFQM